MYILRYIIDIVVPAFSAFLAADDTVIKWLVKKQLLSTSFNIQGFQKVCLIINILFTVFVLCIRLGYHEHREKHFRNEMVGLYHVIKQFIQSNFVSISKDKNFNFNLRIFVPEINIWRFLKSILLYHRREKWFVIRNIEPFAKKDITEHLRLRVDPDEQGLVGQAYKKGSIVYDDMLELTNDKDYSLERAQVNRTKSLLWSLCVPILNDNNDVIAVMSFDSDSSYLDIEKNKDEIRTLTNTLAIMLNDSVPEMFKKKWSLR